MPHAERAGDLALVRLHGHSDKWDSKDMGAEAAGLCREGAFKLISVAAITNEKNLYKRRCRMLRRWPTLLLAVIGIALVAVGVSRVVVTASGAGLVTIVVVGALLLVTPFVLSRVERLTLNASGFDLQLTRDMAGLGAPGAARLLEHTDLARFAESYSFVVRELDDERYREAKLHLQDLLVERAAAIARKEKFDAAEVRAMFANAAPAMRVLALGLMKGDSELADGGTVLAAIADPKSANEQYQGLELAKLCWPHLSSSYRAAIRSVIEGNAEMMAGPSRRPLAQEILALPLS